MTEYQHTAVIVSATNQLFETLDITPTIFHRGSRNEITFLIKNLSNKNHNDIDIEIEKVEREIFQEPLSKKDDPMDDITLRPGEQGELKILLDTDIDAPEGVYNMLYYFHFYELNGQDYRTPLSLKKFNLIQVNNDLKDMDIEPSSI